MTRRELTRYAMRPVFRVAGPAALDGAAGRPLAGYEASASPAGREVLAAEFTGLPGQAAGKGIVTRGCYDIQGLRAGAGFMFWWLAPAPDGPQEIYIRFRRTRLGRASEPVWPAMALHRPAEFSKDHLPAFLAGNEPRAYLSVYPYLRSHEWYLCDPAGRRVMLAGARHDGAGLPGCAVQHGGLPLAERLRVDHRAGGRRPADCRPHAASARRVGAPAHPGRDPVFHRAPQADRRTGGHAVINGQRRGRRPGCSERRAPDPAAARDRGGHDAAGV